MARFQWARADLRADAHRWRTGRAPRRDEETIGVVLPPSVPGALVNVGITLAGRIPVNLNSTAAPEAMAAARERCPIRTVVTSRVFLATAKIEALDGMVFVDASIDAIAQHFWIAESDRIVGLLPFFHSFGYTVTIWFPLIAGCGVVYHPNPTDAKAIGELTAKYQATLLLSTPTFCGGYARTCSVEEFASLRIVLVGGDKLPEPVAFREKFGVELLAGYGCTEMAPVVAVNTHNIQTGKGFASGQQAGYGWASVAGCSGAGGGTGHVRTAGAESGRAVTSEGVEPHDRLPGRAGRRAKPLHDGWYITGDISAARAVGRLVP